MISKKKKILVVGNADSVFIQGFINEFSKEDVEINLLSVGCKNKIVINCNYRCVSFSKPRLKSRLINYIIFVFNFFRALSSFGTKYDCIFVQFVSYLYFIPVIFLRFKCRRLVSVIWGSDFYRSGFLKKSLQFFIYFLSDKIGFTNPLTLIDFKRTYWVVPEKRLMVARFGLPVLDEIDSIKLKISYVKSCKEFFFLPLDKIIVLVGYNGSASQRHEDVIESISRLDGWVLDKLHFVFHVGYAAAGSLERIEKKIKEKKLINYTFLDKFYNSHDIAKLRCVTDILINVQNTDQYSGTMQETLYAGGYVIAGDWLPYNDLIENECNIKTVDSIVDVGKMVEFIYSNINDFDRCKLDRARQYIRNTSSWSSNILKWRELAFS